ncbi:hydrolase (plasmid) [Klebsiella pneumoniae]|uniref:HAD family hydrolase n=1 Tax=Klebsiella pneumoniae TaxID=573 RepID=UPI001C77C0CC|nr:HAD family hydrolase [Klebsiella pneumoniae]BCY40037.1 hydrolase [Klebsiella pneumoniae]
MSLALFDFDGTITTRETMPDFVRRSVSRRRLLVGQLLLAPLVLGYKIGILSGTLIRRVIVRFAYSGIPASVPEAQGRDFAQSYLPNTLRGEAMQRIAWHKAQGHKVVVVSGGLEAYLEPWCDSHGVELICSSLQQSDGILTGRYEGRQCVLTEKARLVRERYDGDISDHLRVRRHAGGPDMLAIATKQYYQWQEVGVAGGR